MDVFAYYHAVICKITHLTHCAKMHSTQKSAFGMGGTANLEGAFSLVPAAQYFYRGLAFWH
jgi:hypothetical protein